MPKPDRYLERACAAVINAGHASDPKRRQEFLSLARAWGHLADFHQRSRELLTLLNAPDASVSRPPRSADGPGRRR